MTLLNFMQFVQRWRFSRCQNSFMQHNFKKSAFTLAEVLIALGVIGVVAALTIPSLVKNINDRVTAHQETVLKNKIVQALNMMNSQENGLTKSYENTEEFVRALSKYMKMTTICTKDELNKCFAYDKVNYSNNGKIENVNLTDITTATDLQLSDSFLDPAGFVMGDGTPVIISWNSKCADEIILDSDKPLEGNAIPTDCLDGVYDINGTRKMNMYGKDVKPFKKAKIGTDCVAKLGQVCLSSTMFKIPQGLTQSECEAEKAKNYGIVSCPYNNDYWAAAMKKCYDSGTKLPTMAQLAEIASQINPNYKVGALQQINDSNFLSDTSSAAFAPFKEIYFSQNDGKGYWFGLWSSDLKGDRYYVRWFDYKGTHISSSLRTDAPVSAICVSK